jgi:hypothetical protein
MSRSYDIGEVVVLSCTTTIATTKVNAVSVSCQVRLPDGSTEEPTVTRPSTGQYVAEFKTTLAGQHFFRFESLDPDGAREGTFLVRESDVLT